MLDDSGTWLELYLFAILRRNIDALKSVQVDPIAFREESLDHLARRLQDW